MHYLGYQLDRGGIIAVIRALAQTGRFRCLLGVNPGFTQQGAPQLETLELPPLRAETLSVATAWRAWAVAWRLRAWLRAGERRVVHTHSRAGLFVACWLRALGESRVLATVHAYGRRPAIYRAMKRLLGARLKWLTPAMKEYYGVGDGGDWSDCLPDCVSASAVRVVPPRSADRRPVVFGCVGGLVPVKQWALVLQALARVPPDVPVRVIHIGAEDATEEGAACVAHLRELAADQHIAPRWEWRPPQENLGGFYGDIDCLLVPSRWEASSVAALEAIAAGVPVLASSASGTRDLVGCCAGGWTFSADSAAALAEKMTALASGATLSEWRRDEAGLARFLAPTVAEAHRAAYLELLHP